MFNWLTKLMMHTPHQGNCAGGGSANREQMESLRKKMTEGSLDIQLEEAPSVGGGCCGGGSCGTEQPAKEKEHECCGGANCQTEREEGEEHVCCGGGCCGS